MNRRKKTLAAHVAARFAPTAVSLACAFPLVAIAQAVNPAKTEEKDTTLPEVQVKGTD